MSGSAGGGRPGVLVERPGLSILDTRELGWEAAPELLAGAARKPLGGSATAGEPVAELLFVPGGTRPPAAGARLADGAGETLLVGLAGELAVTLGRTAAQVLARPVHLRSLVAVHAPPGCAVLLDEAPTPPCGWIGLAVRTAAAATPAAAPAAPTVVDGRAAEWEPADYADSPPVFHKVLARYPGGDTKLQLLFFPPGLDPVRSEFPFYPPVLQPARHHHHVLVELLYVLDGDMPLSEWASAAERHGERVWWREGIFIHRLPSSIHGAEPGATSVTGATILHFRLGGSEQPDGPAFAEPTAVDVPFPDQAEPPSAQRANTGSDAA